MAITLDGTNGILSPDFEPSSSTTPTNGLFLPTTNSLGFATNSTERLRLDASGNLGLGVTPSAWGSGRTALQLVNGAAFASVTSNTYIGNNWYNDGTNNKYISNSYATLYGQNTAGQHVWYTAPSGTAGNAISFTQAMTLDASGNLLVGTTDSSGTSGSGAKVLYNANGAVFTQITGQTANGTHSAFNYYSTGAAAYRFYVGAGGTIYATSTSITAISDISLKENIRPLETGLTEVLALQPRRFDWKNGDGVDVAGFIAQEVIDVLPDLVSDYRYNDDEVKKGLKMGDMIPTLVKAIQELTARLDALEAK